MLFFDTKRNINFKQMKTHKILKLIVIFVLVASWIPILFVSIYSRPSADDFLYSASTHKVIQNNCLDFVGLLQAALHTDIYFYNNWQGLYTSAFVLSLQPGIYGESFYFVGCWLLILLSFVLFSYSVLTFSSFIKLSKKNVLFLALFLYCYIVQSMPYPSEGFLWFNGAWNYTPFLFASLFDLALVFNACVTKKTRYVLWACVVSLGISGGNHVTSFLNILLLLWSLQYAVFYKREHVIRIFLPLLTAILGFTVMYIAPGTSVRQEILSQNWKPDVQKTIASSIDKAIEYVEWWMSVDYLVVLLLFVLFLSCVPIRKIKIKLPSPFIVIVPIAITFVGVLCVPYYALGGFGGMRVVNIHWWVFAVLSFGLVTYVILFLRNQKNWSSSLTTKMPANKTILLSLILLSSIMFSLNRKSFCRTASGEIRRGIAQSFAHSYDDRLLQMNNQRDNNSPLVFTPLSPSGLLNVSDITKDTTDFRNKGWFRYYGVKAIVKTNP